MELEEIKEESEESRKMINTFTDVKKVVHRILIPNPERGELLTFDEYLEEDERKINLLTTLAEAGHITTDVQKQLYKNRA